MARTMSNPREQNTHEWMEVFVLIHWNPMVGEPAEDGDGVRSRDSDGPRSGSWVEDVSS